MPVMVFAIQSHRLKNRPALWPSLATIGRGLRPVLAAVTLGLGADPGQAQVERDAMVARAFEGAQWVMATQAARAVAQMGARAALGDDPLAQLIRHQQEKEADLNTLRKRFGATPPGQRDAVLAQIAKLERELQGLTRRIAQDFPDYAEFANPRPLSFEAIRAELAQDEALILFLSTPQATHVWAVSHHGEVWHRADLSERQLSRYIRELRDDLDPTGPARAAAPLAAPVSAGQSFDHEIAFELYNRLLAPILPVLGDSTHLMVVKDGALSSLPLALLKTEAGPDAPWLLERFALTTLPGVSSLASIRSQVPQQEQRASYFLGFGNPDFQAGSEHSPPPDATADQAAPHSRAIGGFFDETGPMSAAIATLTPLPGTARELRQIASLFPSGQASVKLGPEATESAVKAADLAAVSILSFATHGLITGDISGLAEPALALTPPKTSSAMDDGLLTASEASQLELSADWVILSACNTAAGDGAPGAEGLSGLARAFLFAGAQSILVSHWPVRDDVAARLTSDTLRRLRDRPGLGRSKALRLSMLEMMRDPADPSLAHPSAWAPFVVVGEGGALNSDQ